jgi:hypothetical protein
MARTTLPQSLGSYQVISNHSVEHVEIFEVAANDAQHEVHRIYSHLARLVRWSSGRGISPDSLSKKSELMTGFCENKKQK